MVIVHGREPDARKRLCKLQGERIRKARIQKGLSLDELAEACSVSVGAVSHWEVGRFRPRQEMQLKIAKSLNVPWSFLFGLDGEVT